jgi:hypothetical protein
LPDDVLIVEDDRDHRARFRGHDSGFGVKTVRTAGKRGQARSN